MNMKSFRPFARRVALVAVLSVIAASSFAIAAEELLFSPEKVLKDTKLWGEDIDIVKKQADKYWGGGLKQGLDAAKDARKYYDTLTEGDKKLEADYQPPGAPSVPSRCMEDKACRPCFTEAYGSVNKTRKFLEQVRARYELTHKLTTQGKAFMQGVAGAGGGIAALGAQAEVEKVDGALANFDKIVRDKNTELLGRLEKNLREVGVCEAKYYKNDDWYERYGYMYYQFMLAHYAY
jgi:hypothetical protein